MNTCKRFEVHVSAWLDDELDRSGQVEMVDHLVRCPACREFTREARNLDGMVATVRPPRDAVEPSPEVWAGIQQSLGAASVRRDSTGGWGVALRAAAVVILSVALAVLFFGGTGTPAPGSGELEVQLGGNPQGMDDSRFMELTAEVLRADPRYHAALYQVMEQVVRETGADEASYEFERTEDTSEEPRMADAIRRNPV